MNSAADIRFFAYARKSSEDSHRQVASIGDQTAHLTSLVQREGLVLAAKPFTEERSAKDPGRPVFNDVLARIERGEANGLVCWDIDRLSRNPIDNGRLQWMLQKGVIRVIKTPGRAYYPEDAGLLMSIEGGRATDYVMRLSKNVKRGLAGRVARGHRPSRPPVGYMLSGDKGNKTAVPDPERFELVRRIFDLYLSGSHPVLQIMDMANNQWGLRTVKQRTQGGRPLALAHFYMILNNPFYYGYFEWKNQETGEVELHKSNHQPMITEAEHRRVQILLGHKAKFRHRTYESPYAGLISCGECHSSITLDVKDQVICSECRYKFACKNRTACPRCYTAIDKMANPTRLHYEYLHCTKKKNRACTQKSILVENLEKQIDSLLEKVTIDDEYLNLALEYLDAKREHESGTTQTVQKSLQSAVSDIMTRLRNLEREYTSVQNSNHELYTSEEFKTAKQALIAERTQLEASIGDLENGFDRSIDETERVVNFCNMARQQFKDGPIERRREIVREIGSNLTLTDKKLNIDRLNPFLLIENELSAQRALRDTLEPKKRGANTYQNVLSMEAIQSWRAHQDSNLGRPFWRRKFYH